MRKCVFPALLFLLPAGLFAQSNNPYNQSGVDYVNSLAMIKNDFAAGKVTEFSESTLNYYSRSVPLRNQVSVDMAAAIVNNMKNPGFSFANVIDNSTLSGYSRNLLKDIISNESHLDDNGYRANLAVRTNEVLAAGIPATEKEFVLSLVAVAYNIADPVTPDALANGREYGGCWITGPNGSGPGTRAQCIAAGAFLGGVLGYSICGVLCGIGGAIIGGVAGALS